MSLDTAISPLLGVIPLGPFGDVGLRVVAANLQAVLGIGVDILPGQEIPPHTFLPHRRQYDAALLVKHLAQQAVQGEDPFGTRQGQGPAVATASGKRGKGRRRATDAHDQEVRQGPDRVGEDRPAGYLRLLGLTRVDLCVPILTYVFGEAEMGGKAAVVSNFRLYANDDGSTAPLDRYYERLAKVALHEVAHTLSAYHCEEPTCLMHFCAKVTHLDHQRLSFCERCEYSLRSALRTPTQ